MSEEPAEYTATGGDITAVDETPELLDLKGIGEALGVSYGRLRGYADAEGVKEWVGALTLRGVKGVRYPAESIDKWRAMLAAADQGLVTPKTTAAWVRRARESAEGGALVPQQQPNGSGGGAALVPLAANALMQQSANGGAGGDVLAAIRELTAALQQNGRPDRLLSRKDAAAEFGISQDTLKRHVPCVVDGGRRKYRESDVQAYIRGLDARR